jgi:hypothetical protein
MHNFSLKVWRSSGLRRWKTGFVLRLIFVANIMLLTSCDSFHGDYQGNEGNKMEVVKQSSVSHVSQPPVDLNLPAKVETATFALG